VVSITQNKAPALSLLLEKKTFFLKPSPNRSNTPFLPYLQLLLDITRRPKQCSNILIVFGFLCFWFFSWFRSGLKSGGGMELKLQSYSLRFLLILFGSFVGLLVGCLLIGIFASPPVVVQEAHSYPLEKDFHLNLRNLSSHNQALDVYLTMETQELQETISKRIRMALTVHASKGTEWSEITNKVGNAIEIFPFFFFFSFLVVILCVFVGAGAKVALCRGGQRMRD
jgi:hypothetical protein